MPILPAALTGWLHPKAPVWTRAALTEGEIPLAQVPAQVLWVDAREDESFSLGHIPGAINLNETHWDDRLETFLNAWNPDVLVVVYCNGEACHASHSVADRLRRELQIENVKVLTGGWPSWEKAHR